MATLEGLLDPEQLILVEQTLDRTDAKKGKWLDLIDDMVSQGRTANDIKQRLSGFDSVDISTLFIIAP